MSELTHPRERLLGNILLGLGILVWLGIIIGTFGTALIGLLAGFVVYLFLQSTLIAHVRGNGIELTTAQLPELHAQFVACCERLQITDRPKAFVLNGDGVINAFATRFLGAQYVVLLSGTLDAMKEHEDGVRFYIGHELGHLRMKHLQKHLFQWPVLWLPLLGAAYSRARESTCDRHGAACSSSPQAAARALCALSAGSVQWKNQDLDANRSQLAPTSGFWMSFHELTAGYPWVVKRVARVLDPGATMPARNGFSYVLALIIPYAGRLGGGFGFLVMVYFIGILAAVAIPQYQQYTVRGQLQSVVVRTESARTRLLDYYQQRHEVPGSLDMAGIPVQIDKDIQLSLDPGNMTLTAETPKGTLVFTPRVAKDRTIFWTCAGAEKLQVTMVPASCSTMGRNGH